MGNIEYHYFAGYSGGAKAIMPGVSTREAIRANHSMMVMDEARAGNLMSPVRLDIEEAGALLGIDYILNVVLDEHKKIIYAVAGDVVKAHRAGTEFLDKLYCVKIEGEADVVVVSAGGYPKDQNMYRQRSCKKHKNHNGRSNKSNRIIQISNSLRDSSKKKNRYKWINNPRKYSKQHSIRLYAFIQR